ncbi:MAG: hypothetical protein IT293_20775 [Deltaproteobacteria bacterium]|nr:hypothetical protein [Deltaproteobacteria bacterium]
MADEFAPAKARFVALVREIDPDVAVVIPERSTQDAFLISLTRGANRRFLTLSEDDMLDLVEDPRAAATMHARLRAEVAAL